MQPVGKLAVRFTVEMVGVLRGLTLPPEAREILRAAPTMPDGERRGEVAAALPKGDFTEALVFVSIGRAITLAVAVAAVEAMQVTQATPETLEVRPLPEQPTTAFQSPEVPVILLL